MKCVKCGAELKLGCIYCSVCGQEAQIVSDSNLLEEELLRELLKEENPQAAPKETTGNKKKAPKKKKRTHKPLIITMVCLCILILAGVILVVGIREKNNNSYPYQMDMAQQNFSEKNYVKALQYLKRALELNPQDIDARKQMAEIYSAMEEKNKAISMLHEILSMESSDRESCQKLIQLYEQEKNYEAILKLKEELAEEALADLFDSYETLPPAFSLKPGEYSEYITFELTAGKECDIYYTLDGSSPVEHGTLYKEPFQMEEQGMLKITAVARNAYGIYSDTVTGTFEVKFQKPKMAVANPDSGSFTEPATIELTGSEGCHIYYTWDGSEPTAASAEYTGPIEVPVGNNILSVILIDKYGMVSDVLKCNYRYFP